MDNMIEDQNPAFKTRRPFASPSFATAILECTKYNLMEHIENRRLPLAFDIGVPGATRLCLRVAAANVLAVKTGLKPLTDMEKFLDGAFPADKPVFRPPRLAWILHCDYDHIYHLLETRALDDAGGATRYQIPRESIIGFMAKRRLA
jgi:hypothetical protein